MEQINTITAANRDSATTKQHHFTSAYKHLKASIAFVLMIIAATGWGV
ncbi:MAG: hypothetical protein Q7U66_04185 [Methylobacter sp.]|nr:hypothetical protein [Methylobacter sp.]